MTSPDYASLRSNVNFLGRLLGETIAAAQGPDFLKLIEEIRLLSKRTREGSEDAWTELQSVLNSLENDQLVPVARAFSQFLNLANIADQHYNVSRESDEMHSAANSLVAGFRALIDQGVERKNIEQAISQLKIELVLTAHPTEITRRTLIHKHGEIGRCLAQLELQGLTQREKSQLHSRLRELIAQIWFGDDFRTDRPTPVDEAKWGFAVVEDSLWRAVPNFLRHLDQALQEFGMSGLPLEAKPVSFVSWMGGDRDGNPNVTATITSEVMLLSRWQAVDLYLSDIDHLVEELSMTHCSAALAERAGGGHEPYRIVLRELRSLLRRSLSAIEAELNDEPVPEGELLHSVDQLWDPLKLCYDSLIESGMHIIADGALLDALRRVSCFGVHLVKHDVRQDSSRHAEALSELTSYLGLGDYADWEESRRCEFLLTELVNRRPLLSDDWQPSAAVKEVLDTCRVVAQQSPQALGAYVISMARQASDILAVHLLLKAVGCHHALPVVPLFETLDDLSRARTVMATLLEQTWYRDHLDGELMVMIGYSDSAKDAGVLAAAWAQYRAQEELLELCGQYDTRLTLFHGRGGTIGRGGAPAQDALLSQPPGSLQSGLRVTEQGEMIRAKLGWSSMAEKTLALYCTAICQANLLTPPAPREEWREMMFELASDSCDAYRAIVREEEEFVSYFRYATPEQELAKLPLGSRPARRPGSGGIESLRAIPWIFAWSQNRLMLPAWLGAGAALQQALERNKDETLREMVETWPFFT
ncbi:MAG: phosphoenolpyruvate carboxylase, partial [Pseudomonadota bacterium]